jgi:hydrogenase maturation protein HypF
METGGVMVGEEVSITLELEFVQGLNRPLPARCFLLPGIVCESMMLRVHGAPTIPDSETIRLQLQIRGVVQGVGFRPYVYNLARRHALAGFVLNSPRGVFIEVEGDPATVEAFVSALPAEAPPLVRIAQILRTEIPTVGDSAFAIHESDAAGSAFALVPPDICVCEACLADTRDPANRRHDYPFTNCTNCGPRYSIILDVPYDRPMTTMAEFAMCDDCLREYKDPEEPPLPRAAERLPCLRPAPHPCRAGPESSSPPTSRAILERVADLLRAGGIVAWKGLGGYQLACDARQPAAVEELRRRKRRSEKPFAIMVADADVARRSVCFVSEEREALLEAASAPSSCSAAAPVRTSPTPSRPATPPPASCSPARPCTISSSVSCASAGTPTPRSS